VLQGPWDQASEHDSDTTAPHHWGDADLFHLGIATDHSSELSNTGVTEKNGYSLYRVRSKSMWGMKGKNQKKGNPSGRADGQGHLGLVVFATCYSLDARNNPKGNGQPPSDDKIKSTREKSSGTEITEERIKHVPSSKEINKATKIRTLQPC